MPTDPPPATMPDARLAYYKLIGHLNTERARQHLSHGDISQQLGYDSKGTVQHWFAGTRITPGPSLLGLAGVLGYHLTPTPPGHADPALILARDRLALCRTCNLRMPRNTPHPHPLANVTVTVTLDEAPVTLQEL